MWTPPFVVQALLCTTLARLRTAWGSTFVFPEALFHLTYLPTSLPPARVVFLASLDADPLNR